MYTCRRYIATKLSKDKSETGNSLIEIINQIEAANNLQLSRVQADWGGEFRHNTVQEDLKKRGIAYKESFAKHR